MATRTLLVAVMASSLSLALAAVAAGSQSATATPFSGPLAASFVDAASADASTILASTDCKDAAPCGLYVAGSDGSGPVRLAGAAALPVGVSNAGVVAWQQSGTVYVGKRDGSVVTSVASAYATLGPDGSLLVPRGGGVEGLAAHGILLLTPGATQLQALRFTGSSTAGLRFSISRLDVPLLSNMSLIADVPGSDSAGALPGTRIPGVCATPKSDGLKVTKDGAVALGAVDLASGTVHFLRPKAHFEALPWTCVSNAEGSVVVMAAGKPAPNGRPYSTPYLLADYHGHLRQIPSEPPVSFNSPGIYEFATLSPDGRFAVLTPKGNYPVHYPVEIVDLATGRITRYIKQSEGFVQWAWSPDSSKLGFQLGTDGPGPIGVIAPASHSMRMLKRSSYLGGFTPDSQRVLVLTKTGALATIPVSGGATTSITGKLPYPSFYIHYSPDLSLVWLWAGNGPTWYLPSAGFGTSQVGIP